VGRGCPSYLTGCCRRHRAEQWLNPQAWLYFKKCPMFAEWRQRAMVEKDQGRHCPGIACSPRRCAGAQSARLPCVSIDDGNPGTSRRMHDGIASPACALAQWPARRESGKMLRADNAAGVGCDGCRPRPAIRNYRQLRSFASLPGYSNATIEDSTYALFSYPALGVLCWDGR